MPAVDTVTGGGRQPRKKRVRVRKPKQTYKVTVPDAGDSSRTTRATSRPRYKVTVPDQKDATRSRRVSKPLAGDAPQTRKVDTQRAENYVRKQYENEAKKGIIRSAGGKQVRYVPRTTVLPQTAHMAAFDKGIQEHKAQQIARLAPVLKVLDQTTRPIHAVAGAADAAVTHKSISKAALRGLQNKDKTTFSDVLKHAGVKNKTIRGLAGFTLDVGLDPTTYLTAGTGSVARKAALEAGEKAAKDAAKQGLSKKATKVAVKHASTAAYQANARKGAGVTVKVAGKELPGVRRASAAAGRGGGAVSRKVVPERARSAVRDVASEVSPGVAPAGVSKAVHEKARDAARKARATRTRGERAAINVAHGIKSQIGEKNYAHVVDAVEAGDITSLPSHLQPHARTVAEHLKAIRKIQKDAGVKVPERKGYIPRKLTPETIKAEQKKAARVGGKGSTSPASSKARKETRTMAELRAQEPGRYREDLHALVAERLAEGHASAARANLAQDLAKLGRKVQAGTKPVLGDREALYRVRKGHELAEVDPNSKAFRNGKGNYVALNRALVERTMGTVATPAGGAIKHGYDKTQAGFKRLALGTPAFHLRNFVGDTSQAYVHQPGYKLPVNMVRAGRVLKAVGREEKAQRALGAKPSGGARAVVRQVGRHVGRRHLDQLGNVDQNVAKMGRGKPGIEKKSVKFFDGTPGVRYVARDQSGDPVGHLSFEVDASGGVKSIAVEVRTANRRQGVATRLYDRAKRDGYDIDNPQVRTRTDLGSAFVSARHKAAKGSGTLKTKRYGHVTYEEAAQKLIEAGAARSGYTARELRELAQSGNKKIRLPKTPAGARRAFLNREDLPRLATAIHAVREGATWEEAARKVANVHFDYAELTPFERNTARRILPFYTWTSRNVPLQAKRLVTNPGKYAAYQKVREEAMKAAHPDSQDPQTRNLYKQLEAAGVRFPKGWEKYLTEYEQRNAGIPVSWKGHKFTISMGLPLTDLNELPGAAGAGQATEYLNKAASLVTPLVKDPVEFGFNYSFFFRDQVERDNSPLVAAPSVVGSWPDWAKKKFGVVKAVDKRSGKMVWQWPGRADYVAHAVPGLVSSAVKMATPGHDRQGKGLGAKALSLAGVKAAPIDATTNAVNLAYARQQEIQKRLAVLRAQGVGKDNPTVEWRRLSDQLKLTTQIAYQGKAKRGDAVLPTQGGPPKPRGGASPRVKFGSGSTSRVHFGVSTGSRVRFGG